MTGFLGRLFSRGAKAEEPPRAEPSVEYNGYTITPIPEKGPGGWRVVGTISREVNGRLNVHHLGRADTAPDRDVIVSMTIEKAKRVIDQQGDRMFNEP